MKFPHYIYSYKPNLCSFSRRHSQRWQCGGRHTMVWRMMNNVIVKLKVVLWDGALGGSHTTLAYGGLIRCALWRYGTH